VIDPLLTDGPTLTTLPHLVVMAGVLVWATAVLALAELYRRRRK